jgi:hypothetical protein
MPSTPPITSAHQFSPSSSNLPDAKQATALEFIADRAAGIEWELHELNDKLFRILSVLRSPTNP